MRTLKGFIILGILSGAVFVSCKKQDSTATTTTTPKPVTAISYQKRWNVSTISHRPANVTNGLHRPAGTGDFSAIEFLINSTYVIFYTGGSIATGQYTSPNDSTLVLDSVGTVHILELDSTSFDFVLQLSDGSDAVTITAAPAPITIVVSSPSDSALLSTVWKADSVVDNTGDVDSFFSQGNYYLYITFSPYGTYEGRDNLNGYDEFETNTWLWSDNTHTKFCYGNNDGQNITDCNGLSSISIVSFEPPYTHIVFLESDSTYSQLDYMHKE